MKKVLFVVLLVLMLGLPAFASDPLMIREQGIFSAGGTVIPASYFKTADKQGSIVKETYRSRDYTLGNSEEITKTAYVYLPYGYNADDKERRGRLRLCRGNARQFPSCP